MLINELAKRTGVSIHTLRYYENLGLFQGAVDLSVKTNNYKNYDENLVDQISLIKDAKDVGFTLAEIKFLLESWTDEKLKTADKISIFRAKINEIDLKITQFKKVKGKLIKTIKDIENGDC
jgi:MerR family copper efflux transcriptional regulator